MVIFHASNGEWNYGKQSAESKSGLCVTFNDALIILAISWSSVFHVDYLEKRFKGQVLEAANLTYKKILEKLILLFQM